MGCGLGGLLPYNIHFHVCHTWYIHTLTCFVHQVDLDLIEALLEYVSGDGRYRVGGDTTTGLPTTTTTHAGTTTTAAAAAGAMNTSSAHSDVHSVQPPIQHQSLQQQHQETGIDGAILVFMPGWDEIIRMKEKLEKSQVFGVKDRYVRVGV